MAEQLLDDNSFTGVPDDNGGTYFLDDNGNWLGTPIDGGVHSTITQRKVYHLRSASFILGLLGFS